MRTNFNRTAMVALVGLFLTGFGTVPLYGKQGKSRKPIQVTGVIIERLSDGFTMRNYLGSQHRVDLSTGTRIKEKKKNFLREPKLYSPEHLIPGLEVTVKGVLRSGRMTAEEIKFTQDGLKAARVLYSRLHPLEDKLAGTQGRLESVDTRAGKNAQKWGWLSGQMEEVKAGLVTNRNDIRKADRATQRAMAGVDAVDQRISKLDDYEVVKLVTVHFGFDSCEFSSQEKSKLDDLFAPISRQKGYLVEVRGFASEDGDELHNRTLSQRRADMVRDYIMENHDVSLRRFIMPFGYGSKYPVADNSTLEGRKKNRRVEVKILVNQGLEGGKGRSGFTARLNPFR